MREKRDKGGGGRRKAFGLSAVCQIGSHIFNLRTGFVEKFSASLLIEGTANELCLLQIK
ncbi:unknown [Clostridium sp. CAG:448]|nr:unknown [Clostridium sp. CAG:448]